jgi:succinate dehydrogenase/fumarate reductase cytochrome b subunit
MIASKNQKVKNPAVKRSLLDSFRKALSVMAAFFMFQMTFAQDVAREIEDLMDQQIMPIVNVIVAAALVFSAVYAGILFFQGKKEGLKIVGYIIAGALVIKFMAEIAQSIIGTN